MMFFFPIFSWSHYTIFIRYFWFLVFYFLFYFCFVYVVQPRRTCPFNENKFNIHFPLFLDHSPKHKQQQHQQQIIFYPGIISEWNFYSNYIENVYHNHNNNIINVFFLFHFISLSSSSSNSIKRKKISFPSWLYDNPQLTKRVKVKLNFSFLGNRIFFTRKICAVTMLTYVCLCLIVG